MITLKELADECSVSIATVSNILNGKSNVSEKTRQRIIKKINETGYKPNFLARGLRAKTSKIIGLIIEDISLFSSPQIIEGIMSYFENMNYKVILENLRLYSKWGHNWYKKTEYVDEVNQAIDEFLSIRVDGIIYVAGHARIIDCINEKLNIPLVISYSFSANSKYKSITIDDKTSSKIMTNYLISLNHTKIAVIKGTENNFHTIYRLQGFMESLNDSNIIPNEKIIVNGEWNRESGYKSCKKLFATGESFSAIFCFNDLMAAGVYDYLHEINKDPKKDIFVCGFDNNLISDFLNPPLTTMKIPLEEIGQKSAEILYKQLCNEETTNCTLPCILLKK